MRQGGGERSARRGVDTIRGDGAEKFLNEEAPTRRARCRAKRGAGAGAGAREGTLGSKRCSPKSHTALSVESHMVELW